jgi:putative FmdB family regulatory protein
MPIYEYRCAACGGQHEVLQKMSDAPMTDCPSCGQPALSKLVSAAGFQLKGSGWYVTDFKGAAKPNGKDKDQDNKKEDSKPAAETAKTEVTCGAGACPAC